LKPFFRTWVSGGQPEDFAVFAKLRELRKAIAPENQRRRARSRMAILTDGVRR
jgi:hypothetical protein